MLNDISFRSNDKALGHGVTDALVTLKRTKPYRILPSSHGRDSNVIIFNDNFIYLFRLVLSEADGACITRMNDEEREVYYSFVDYQNGDAVENEEMAEVVAELDNCIVNEVECKTATYIDRCFDVNHEWDTCAVTPSAEAKTKTLTQADYDTIVSDGEIVDSTTYLITENSVVTKIYVGALQTYPQI